LSDPIPTLKPNLSAGASITPLEGSAVRLEIPPGPEGRYRLAQLDDYTGLFRKDFPWKPPVVVKLSARTSSSNIPGTWGFGLWNDPFSLSLGVGGGTRRFPALPNSAWFFNASPQNYLSLQDANPAHGFLAQTFRSNVVPAPFLALGAIGFPLMVLPVFIKVIRPILSKFIHENVSSIDHDVTQWHDYSLACGLDGDVLFQVDGEPVHETDVIPNGPLGLVLWIDNQYLALPPNGKMGYGHLENPETVWLEIKGLMVNNKPHRLSVYEKT